MIGIPQTTFAISFTAFDARSMAMGGAGVATAKPYNAILFNPALLVNREPQLNKSFVRPFLGARLIDRDKFIDSVENFQSNAGNDRLGSSLENFDTLLAAGVADLDEALILLNSARGLIGEAGSILSDFEELSNKPLRVATAGGISFGHAGEGEAFGGLIRRNSVGGTIINLTETDIGSIRNLIDTSDLFIDSLATLLANNPTPEELNTLINDFTGDDFQYSDELTSTIEFQGAIVEETAFSYATYSEEFPDWRLGITLKQIDFTTVDYSELISEGEIADFNNKQFQRSYADINWDVGITVDFESQSRLGFVIRNLISREYQTVRNRTIKLKPLVRIGAAWESVKYTLTADLDITSNDPLGFDPDKRYLAIGGEMRIWHNLALRSGYRYNTVSGSDLWSVGMGIGPLNAHADIAIAAQGDELGLAVQFAAYF